jgi:hypothetical protein
MLYFKIDVAYAHYDISYERYRQQGYYREIFHVTSSADSGVGSLREALEEIISKTNKEINIGDSMIYFNIPEGIIKPHAPLPNITKNISFIGPISFDMSEMRGENYFIRIKNADCLFPTKKCSITNTIKQLTPEKRG